MKEMVYMMERMCEVLHSGEYKGYKFAIINTGYYPTAYVENKRCFADFEIANKQLSILPHGGFTYDGNAYWNENDKTNYLGWDYGHCGDFSSIDYLFDEDMQEKDKKWTTQEIYEGVKRVINGMIEFEREL